MSTRELYEREQDILDRLRSEPMSQFERDTLGMERASIERRMMGRDSTLPELMSYLVAQGVYSIPKAAYFSSDPGSPVSNFLESATKQIMPATPFNRQTTSPPNVVGNMSQLIGGFRDKSQRQK